jgi:hypothetical protein
MTSSPPVSDLLALATLRRMLLELGCEIRLDEPGLPAGPLELWMHEPRPQLEGMSPLQAMQKPDGAERVRQCLIDLIDRHDPAAG